MATAAKTGRSTAIRRCGCEHAWQDKHYGRRMRVHNRTANTGMHGEKWRCTVCGATR